MLLCAGRKTPWMRQTLLAGCLYRGKQPGFTAYVFQKLCVTLAMDKQSMQIGAS